MPTLTTLYLLVPRYQVTKRGKFSTKTRKSSRLQTVLDDVLGLLGSNQSFFSSLCSRYRHYNMSIVITTQDFKRIPQTARYNCSTYCLFKSHNQKEIEKLDDELGGMFPKFLDLYKEATSEKFSFLYLDMEKARAFKRFDTLLWEK
jgi:hypothetical protein